MSYQEAIQFLYGLRWFGAKFGLENTRQLASLAGNPQNQLRFIHVAGTNGKGSTCAMLESIYRAAGLRTGLFTSPHLVSFRERIQVNRQLIGEKDVVRLVEEVAAGILPAVEPGFQPGGNYVDLTMHTENSGVTANSSACPGGKMPPSTAGRMPTATFFEFITVMALRYFAEQKCDLVIWETGLGGRLDATNIVTPLASVITNIALDHQQWLGDTILQIAAEKAGVIKPGVPVVTAVDDPEALAVIEETARRMNAPLTMVNADHAPRITHHVSLPLPGDHQRLNAALAVKTVDALQAQIPVTPDAIQRGLETVSWPGRMQQITRSNGQRLILDGAHNVAGARALRLALERKLAGQRCTLILGVLADKDWRHVCEALAPLATSILTVPVSSNRSADAVALAEACRTANPSAATTACDSLKESLERSAADPTVIVAGSLYLVGDALGLLGVLPASPDETALNDWTATSSPHRQTHP